MRDTYGHTLRLMQLILEKRRNPGRNRQSNMLSIGLVPCGPMCPGPIRHAMCSARGRFGFACGPLGPMGLVF